MSKQTGTPFSNRIKWFLQSRGTSGERGMSLGYPIVEPVIPADRRGDCYLSNPLDREHVVRSA